MFIPPPKRYYYATARMASRFTSIEDGSMRVIEGTCFFVRRKGRLFVVTNRHGIDYNYLVKDKTAYHLYDLIIQGRREAQRGAERDHFEPFVLNPIVVMSDMAISWNSDEDLAVFKIDNDPTILAVDSDDIGTDADFRSCIPGEPVIMYGYSRLANVENPAPIARSGFFASDPSVDYRIEGERSARRIAIEAMSTKGMSGSPVFAYQRGTRDARGEAADGYRRMFLAGANTGHYHDDDQKIGSIHSQIGICIRSTVIAELITQADNISQRSAQHA
ncbi:MAG: S1 family peptidase [Bosea sp. (in: a-proteobacteria)]